MAQPANNPVIDTCNACGKLFPRRTMRLCGTCLPVEDNRFQLVRDYVLAHDGAAVTEIARETQVSASDVRRFLESGRLIDITAAVTCCTCGGMGERCRFCRSQLAGTFKAMERKLTQEQGGGGRGLPAPLDQTGRTSYVRRRNRLGETG